MALDPISALLDVGSKVIDRVWPDPAQAASAKLELMKLQQSGELAQIAGQTPAFLSPVGDLALAGSVARDLLCNLSSGR
jgi:hypothetical protein